MEDLKRYLESRSEGVLRLLEGGKRRGLEEMKKGKGRGTQKDLFMTVAASQRTFLEFHERCRRALRYAKGEEARDIALDVQYLLYLFSRQVYTLAFSDNNGENQVSFPPPEAYSRHYPGPGPEEGECVELFARVFADTVYSREKSALQPDSELDQVRKARVTKSLQLSGLS